MHKLFYLIFDAADADGARLRDGLCGEAVPAIRCAGGSEIEVGVADEVVAAGSPVRQSDPPIRAMVSFQLDEPADRTSIEEALSRWTPVEPAGYRVAETRPLAFDRTKGERSPGMKQVTCITRRPDLTREEFLRIWHEDHERVALETQSTFGYVRNEIVEVLAPGAPTHWSAIVEESFPLEALVDPLVFFDARTDAEHRANLDRMLESCRRFMRLDTLEVTFVSEYYFG